MKSFKLLLLTSATCLMANHAQAFDGVIYFHGEITAASCVASGGAGTSVSGGKDGQVIDVNLGKVSMDSLRGSAEEGVTAGTSINLILDCGNTAAGLTTVKFGFDPLSGSGIDPKNNSLLKTAGTASGVGIAMFDADNQLINLSANDFYAAPLNKTGEDQDAKYSATLSMRASYMRNGDDVQPGTATGTLPFTLTYE